MSMLVTIATFSFPHEAHLARIRLEAADIDAFVADEHTINAQWLYSNAMGGVRLQVHATQAEHAARVLAEEDSQDEVVDAKGTSTEGSPDCSETPELRCAQCGGELGPSTVHGRRPAFLSWLLLGLPLWPLRRRLSCLECGRQAPS
jgi:hypothetical protein